MMLLIPCNLQVIICTELCEEGLGNHVLNAVGSEVSSWFPLPMENRLGLEGSASGQSLKSLARLPLLHPNLTSPPRSFHLHFILTSVLL